VAIVRVSVADGDPGEKMRMEQYEVINLKKNWPLRPGAAGRRFATLVYRLCAEGVARPYGQWGVGLRSPDCPL